MHKLIKDPVYSSAARAISSLHDIKVSAEDNEPLKKKCQDMIDVLFAEFPEAAAKPT